MQEYAHLLTAQSARQQRCSQLLYSLQGCTAATHNAELQLHPAHGRLGCCELMKQEICVAHKQAASTDVSSAFHLCCCRHDTQPGDTQASCKDPNWLSVPVWSHCWRELSSTFAPCSIGSEGLASLITSCCSRRSVALIMASATM